VGGPAPFTDKEARFLETLVEEGVEFLVVGLAAAALQGAPAVTQDVDLWFRDLTDPRLGKALRRMGCGALAWRPAARCAFPWEAWRSPSCRWRASSPASGLRIGPRTGQSCRSWRTRCA